MLQSMGSQGVRLYRATELNLNLRDSLMSLRVEKLPAMQETQVQSLGWEDPLEKGLEIHSNMLACRIPWAEVTGGL